MYMCMHLRAQVSYANTCTCVYIHVHVQVQDQGNSAIIATQIAKPERSTPLRYMANFQHPRGSTTFL